MEEMVVSEVLSLVEEKVIVKEFYSSALEEFLDLK
jgi:hypothetical protein